MTSPNDTILHEQAAIFKALGHPARLLMVRALTDGTLCVCELQELVGSDMSTVSKHLSLLKKAGIVRDERRGNNMYYSIELPCVSSFLRCTENAVRGRVIL
ncbi:ArsR/SmtB family transcription factor [Oleidesulfovibrio sp.]|uniref:ArsR/SmtB family transcription factor n=1 Tax=Oleidesulfovibrio sp. TaxID=2909707 RepID=UPI003A8B1139